MLNWHRRSDGTVQAWAPRIMPDDKLPPRYRIQVVGPRQPTRTVELLPHGSPPIYIDTAPNLAAAKARALRDYTERQANG